jgi:hypothetical protein
MHTSSISNKPTSLKLPAALKSQLQVIAQNSGLSLHAFMVQTLADSVQRAHQREAFAQDTTDALREMKASGTGYELADVRTYFSQLAGYRKGQQPKPADISPTRLD